MTLSSSCTQMLVFGSFLPAKHEPSPYPQEQSVVGHMAVVQVLQDAGKKNCACFSSQLTSCSRFQPRGVPAT